MQEPSIYAQIYRLTERLGTDHYAGSVDGWRGRMADIRIGFGVLATAAAVTVMVAFAGLLLPVIGVALLLPWDFNTVVFGAGAATFLFMAAFLVGRQERQHAHDNVIRAGLIREIAALAGEGLAANRQSPVEGDVPAPSTQAAGRRRWRG